MIKSIKSDKKEINNVDINLLKDLTLLTLIRHFCETKKGKLLDTILFFLFAAFARRYTCWIF